MLSLIPSDLSPKAWVQVVNCALSGLDEPFLGFRRKKSKKTRAITANVVYCRSAVLSNKPSVIGSGPIIEIYKNKKNTS